jgi:hypothetical protein
MRSNLIITVDRPAAAVFPCFEAATLQQHPANRLFEQSAALK